jgi:hypothetical protein
MTNYQLAYLNGELFRRSTRKKRPSEDAAIYTDVIQHTVAIPLARHVVDTINNTVFEPKITRDLQFVGESGTVVDTTTQEWTELFLLDADLSNTSLDGVMENIGDLTSVFGHCWVFVDMPYNDGIPDPRLRPYVIPISPLHVWDWDFVAVRGQLIPKYIKVLEHEDDECYRFKCYYLGTSKSPSYWEIYEVEKTTQQNIVDPDILPVATGEFPVGMSIPGFMAFTRRDPRSLTLGISDIDVATDVQKEIYKLEAEAYQAVQFARTLIRVDTGSNITIPAHAGGIVKANEGQVEAIKIDTQDVATIMDKQRALLDDFYSLSGFAGMRQSKSQSQSGISIIQERRTLHRIAGAKARLLEICEESIWTFASRYMSVRWAGEVAYGDDYDSHDTDYRIALLEKAQQMLPGNPVINGIVARELIKMISPESQAEDLIAAMIDTQVGESTIQIIEDTKDEKTQTRDTGDQTPESLEEDSKQDMIEDNEQTSKDLSNSGIRYTGQSYYGPDAVVAQLGMAMAGSGR